MDLRFQPLRAFALIVSLALSGGAVRLGRRFELGAFANYINNYIYFRATRRSTPRRKRRRSSKRVPTV